MLRYVARAALKHPPNSAISTYAHYSVKSASKGSKGKVPEPKSKLKNQTPATHTSSPVKFDQEKNTAASRSRLLAQDESNPSLNVGPHGRLLFTPATSISHLTPDDSCTYINFSRKGLDEKLPEGLPPGMTNEFEDSMRSALLVRRSFLELRDNFRRIVDPSLMSSPDSPKSRKQIVLDGPVSCGKSIALAMLVHWAREEGWLVLYVPKGRDWTHGGYFYKNPTTHFWDTPLQAENVLKDFITCNESLLKELPCRVLDSVPLGEGPGVGLVKGPQSIAIPEGASLYDLILIGIQSSQAAVGVVVRLRKELSLVENLPVLIAVDQYNSWFTFSEYEESVTPRSRKAIHSRDLSMVNAFRSMKHDVMMVGAFSHSTAVGKLRLELPDVPTEARVLLPRYHLDEAATVSYYYLRQRLVSREAFSDEKWKKIFYLTNGNGKEMRCLAPLMQ